MDHETVLPYTRDASIKKRIFKWAVKIKKSVLNTRKLEKWEEAGKRDKYLNGLWEVLNLTRKKQNSIDDIMFFTNSQTILNNYFYERAGDHVFILFYFSSFSKTLFTVIEWGWLQSFLRIDSRVSNQPCQAVWRRECGCFVFKRNFCIGFWVVSQLFKF